MLKSYQFNKLKIHDDQKYQWTDQNQQEHGDVVAENVDSRVVPFDAAAHPSSLQGVIGPAHYWRYGPEQTPEQTNDNHGPYGSLVDHIQRQWLVNDVESFFLNEIKSNLSSNFLFVVEINYLPIERDSTQDIYARAARKVKDEPAEDALVIRKFPSEKLSN